MGQLLGIVRRNCSPIAVRNYLEFKDGEAVRKIDLEVKQEGLHRGTYERVLRFPMGQRRDQGLWDRKRITIEAYGHLCEVSSKDTCNIVGGEGFIFPIEIFAILSF